MKGLNKKGTDKLDILKLPCRITDYKYKKMADEWDITLTVSKKDLEFAQPLMDEMGEHFVVCLIKVHSNAERDRLLRGDLEGIDITP